MTNFRLQLTNFPSSFIQYMVFAAASCPSVICYLLTPLLLQETLQPAAGSHVVRVVQLSGRTGSQAASLSVRRALPQGRRLQTGQYKSSDRSIQNFRQVSIKLQTGQYKSFRQVSTKVDTSHSGHQFHVCG